MKFIPAHKVDVTTVLGSVILTRFMRLTRWDLGPGPGVEEGVSWYQADQSLSRNTWNLELVLISLHSLLIIVYWLQCEEVVVVDHEGELRRAEDEVVVGVAQNRKGRGLFMGAWPSLTVFHYFPFSLFFDMVVLQTIAS